MVITSQRELQAANQELDQAKRRIAELERQLGGSTTRKCSEPFSVRAEEQRQEARGKRQRRRKRRSWGGRKRTAEKINQAVRTEKAFPAGVPEADCWLSHTRPVWRIENGQAVLVAYEIYRGPKNRYGKIPGVFGRSEFGIEIVLAIAYQVYIVGLSFDKACLLMNFFQNLKLRKSQADALMKRLARRWEEEFDVLCMLLANSLVVHTDETGWSIHSVWAFLSEQVRVIFFGVPKDAKTLEQILDPATFGGILISDDAAVYANFTQSQKCWAHLLRKAIKLTLLEPTNAEYRRFADRLLEIYHASCRVQRDRRLSAAGRTEKVAMLEDEVFHLCVAMWAAELPPGEGPEDDYRRLCNELMPAEPGAATIHFRDGRPGTEAQRRNDGHLGNEQRIRTNAPLPGASPGYGPYQQDVGCARRQTVIVSVLESLRQYLSSFTLSSVIEEIGHWLEAGRSCFARLAAKLGLTGGQPHADRPSLLDRLLPVPGG